MLQVRRLELSPHEYEAGKLDFNILVAACFK
jgi:hypothetical protein